MKRGTVAVVAGCALAIAGIVAIGVAVAMTRGQRVAPRERDAAPACALPTYPTKCFDCERQECQRHHSRGYPVVSVGM